VSGGKAVRGVAEIVSFGIGAEGKAANVEASPEAGNVVAAGGGDVKVTELWRRTTGIIKMLESGDN
jgi:hypothetical protein